MSTVWDTSVAGLEDVSFRAGSQKSLLLLAYRHAGRTGLTDDEAAKAAGLSMRSCFWKRCGELREMGLVYPLRDTRDTVVTRKGDLGSERIVCVAS